MERCAGCCLHLFILQLTVAAPTGAIPTLLKRVLLMKKAIAVTTNFSDKYISCGCFIIKYTLYVGD